MARDGSWSTRLGRGGGASPILEMRNLVRLTTTRKRVIVKSVRYFNTVPKTPSIKPTKCLVLLLATARIGNRLFGLLQMTVCFCRGLRCVMRIKDVVSAGVIPSTEDANVTRTRLCEEINPLWINLTFAKSPLVDFIQIKMTTQRNRLNVVIFCFLFQNA